MSRTSQPLASIGAFFSSRWIGFVCLASFASLAAPVLAYEPPNKFLIVSNARNGTMSYGVVKGKDLITMHKLVDDGLLHPQGVAIDQKRQLMFVADSGLRKVVSYGLTASGTSLSVDAQTTVVDDVEARWVAVDGPGNLFLTDELNNKILVISADDVKTGNTKSQVLFDGDKDKSISSPGGIASDNFFVYWTNKNDAANAGTVVKALQASTENATNADGATPKALATNVAKSYGVCVAGDSLYYTDDFKNVYGMKKSGSGEPVQITDSMNSPRGCAWDGFNRIYVADRSAHGVFSLPGPSYSLAEVKPVRVADFEDAFGVGVFSGAYCGHLSGFPVVMLAFVVFRSILAAC